MNQSKLISKPNELERELQQLNEMEIQTIPNDVIGFLNISQDQQQLQSDDQKTLHTGGQSENIGLPFEEVIFYSDSE